MYKGWNCLTYVQSGISLPAGVLPIFELRHIIVSDEPPSKQLIVDLVTGIIPDGVPVFSEVIGIDVPDDLIS